MNYLNSERIVNIAGNVKASELPTGKIINIAGNVELDGCENKHCIIKKRIHRIVPAY